MDDKEKKNLKSLIKSEVTPYLIGLRNEIKEQFGKLLKKGPPEVQKTEEVNPVEFPEVQKVELIDEPEVKKVEITNLQEEVKIKGIGLFIDNILSGVSATAESIKTLSLALGKKFDELKGHLFKVEVQNQKEVKFPDVQKVKLELTKEFQKLIKELKQEVQRVQIENSTPGEAIPVVITDSDKKRFKDWFSQVTGGVNLDKVKEKLDKVIFELQNLEVVIMAEPRPGLAVAELLKESGGSLDLNVDGSVTPVTFSASPPTGKKWFIHSITLIMEDASINFTKFGGIPGGITNGIDIKVKEGGLAERLLGNFKTNGDLHIFSVSVRIDSAATDLLTLQTNIKISSGTTFELKNASSDVFKVIVNDNLTTINRFNVLIKGFEVAE